MVLKQCKRVSSPVLALRNNQGWQLVECLCGVIVSGFMVTAIMAQLTTAERFTMSIKNQGLAADIMQEVVDNARNMTWNDLVANVGTHTLRVNKTSSSQTFDTFFPRALQQDQILLTYSTAGMRNLFQGDAENNGSVVATLTNNGNNTITVVVVVSWKDGAHSGARTARTTTVISQNGIHV